MILCKRSNVSLNAAAFLFIFMSDASMSLVLSKSFETDDPLQPVYAIRRVRHDVTEKQLFLAQKNASLKSGARGLQARKDLKSMESKYEDSLRL